MNTERDRFLTEAMGLCWHEYKEGIHIYCQKCDRPHPKNTDFSTWEGFAKLWEWTRKQEWSLELHRFIWGGDCGMKDLTLTNELVHPDKFANFIYEYLKDNK